MSCRKISRYLDESDLAGLSVSESADVEAHIRECATCAEQYRASNELMTFRSDVPPVPSSLSECARQLDEVCEPMESRGRLRRPFLISSLFLFGATSAMLAALQWPGEKAEFVE